MAGFIAFMQVVRLGVWEFYFLFHFYWTSRAIIFQSLQIKEKRTRRTLSPNPSPAKKKKKKQAKNMKTLYQNMRILPHLNWHFTIHFGAAMR